MAGAGAALAVSFIVLALAWRTPALRRRDARPAGPRWLASPGRQHRLRGGAAGARLRLLRVRRVGGRRGPGPADQPDASAWSTCCCGSASCRCRCCSGRSTGRSARCARSTCVFTRLTGGDPEDGLVTLPRVGRLLARRAGAVRLRVAGAGRTPGRRTSSPVRLWFAAYIAIVIVGAAVFGSDWFERADPFEVYSTLVGPPVRLRPDRRRHAGAAQPAGQPRRRRRRGRAWSAWSRCCSAARRSTASRTPTSGCSSRSRVSLTSTWLEPRRAAGVLPGRRRHVRGRDDGHRRGARESPRRTLPDRFAHSVVPIIVGYIVAHYLSYFVEVGQQTIVQLSDPMGNGCEPARHRGLAGELLALLAPDVPRGAQGARRS